MQSHLGSLKVLMFSHSPYSGGAEHAFVNLVHLVHRMGHQPIVYLPRAKKPTLLASLEPTGAPVHFFERTSIFGNTSNALISLARRDFKSFFDEVASHNPDLIISNSSTFLEAALAAAHLKLPHIWSVHEMQQKNPSTPKGGLADLALARWFSALSDHLIFCSESARAAHELHSITQPGSTVLAPFLERGSAVSSFQTPSTPAASLSVNLMFIGAPTEGKNPAFAIDVTALLRAQGFNAKLYFIGGRRDHTGLVNGLLSRRHLKEHVRFLGKVTDPYRYFTGIAINFISSKSEAFGLTVPESLSRGIPVVAPNFDGPSELLDVDCQYEADDLLACTRVINRIVSNYAESSRKARTNYERLKPRFSELTQQALLAEAIDAATSSYRTKVIPEALTLDSLRSVLFTNSSMGSPASGRSSVVSDLGRIDGELKTDVFVLLRLYTERDKLGRNLNVLVVDDSVEGTAVCLAKAGFDIHFLFKGAGSDKECQAPALDSCGAGVAGAPWIAQIRSISLEDVKAKSYDVVLLMAGLRCESDPIRLLRRWHESLSHDGLLFIEGVASRRDELGLFEQIISERRAGLLPFLASQAGFAVDGFNHDPFFSPLVLKKATADLAQLASSVLNDPTLMFCLVESQASILKAPSTKVEKLKYAFKRLLINWNGFVAKQRLLLAKR